MKVAGGRGKNSSRKPTVTKNDERTRYMRAIQKKGDYVCEHKKRMLKKRKGGGG